MSDLRHGRVRLALHELRAGGAPRLLLLHTLGGSSRDWDVAALAGWPGAVHALDFSGHGGSQPLAGGSYSPELLAADADAALGRLREATLAGAGLGAYVALLLAGGRPERVPAALLLPGAGLAGGGDRPAHLGGGVPPGPEPMASGCDPLLASCARDLRPVDYARAFADRARRLLLAEDGGARPPWWRAAAQSRAAATAPTDLASALAELAP